MEIIKHKVKSSKSEKFECLKLKLFRNLRGKNATFVANKTNAIRHAKFS